MFLLSVSHQHDCSKSIKLTGLGWQKATLRAGISEHAYMAVSVTSCFVAGVHTGIVQGRVHEVRIRSADPTEANVYRAVTRPNCKQCFHRQPTVSVVSSVIKSISSHIACLLW